ncbi:MAG: AAC(3) family N-acetyltransferase [Candidatus Hydrogenedentes bacterium]|nr:AAC(3) family N-acetyltransferase [Candidatus Hydrogenedentota bacterium]
MNETGSAGSAAGPRVRKQDLIAGLRRLGVAPGSKVFAHTSLSAFGWVDGGADAVCDALIEAVSPDGTVAMPTFTWDANHAREVVVFDVRNAPCNVGAIPEAFRQRPGTIRSDHVCHSVAALGPLAAEVMGDGVRPFAEGSSMYRLYEFDFEYLFLGCGFDSCTALHTAEELMAVPYRYYRHFKGSTVIRADGSTAPSRAVEFLRKLPYTNDFGKMHAVYDERGLLRTATVGRARLIGARTRELVDAAVALLKHDIGYLLTEPSRRCLVEDDGGPDTPPG